ncbi:VOC family protein [Granulosicoccus sp. 3-233]|uniref:VOC family protein n=1 Tax=Granulosicoccus sp. 3-233 TaxID=3417969 RepID=UPI003D32E9DC
MQIKKLDHVNVRTAQLERMIDWYTDVLGMRSGKRPDFPFPGAWMYAADSPVVHLVGVDGEAGVGSETTLKLEHFAFSASDAGRFEAHLQSRGIRYERAEVPSANLVQYNVWDPDGNHVHVDFPADE